MHIPEITGIIERRILVNFIIDPKVVQKILPNPFRPKIQNGKAIGGICLIRLKNIKPVGVPDFISISSENAAHRFAVEWDETGKTKEGVFIPRRDTSCRLNAIAGGRIFPGIHHLSQFEVEETDDSYCIKMHNKDNTYVYVKGKRATDDFESRVFDDLDCCSEFFRRGSLGYSPDKKGFDGLLLQTNEWKVNPLMIEEAESSFFNDKEIFPESSVCIDHALLMTNIPHSWKSAKHLS